MHHFFSGVRAFAYGSLLAALTACGGGGGSDSGGSNSGSGNNDGYVLFVSDISVGAITAFKSLDPMDGQPLLAHVVTDNKGDPEIAYNSPAAHVVKTGEGSFSIAYDEAHDDLYVVDPVGTQSAFITIDVFAHASTMVDEAVPTRVILVSGFVHTWLSYEIAIDASHDELWVGGETGQDGNTLGRIVVLSNASTLNGAVSPTRDISGLRNFRTFAHDRVHDILYLAGNGGVEHGVYVYEHASALVSDAPFTRTIDGLDEAAGVATYGITVDEQRDILYVPDPDANLDIVHGASTATQTVVVKVPFPADRPPATAAVDAAHDRLYVTSSGCAFVFDNASTLTSATVVQEPVATQSTNGGLWSFAFP